MGKQKIIIDTDAGHDDALAMLLLICSNQFDILTITTVAGNATIEKVTRNAQAVLDLVGSKISIHSGADKPLRRKLVTAEVHGDSGIDGLDVSNTIYTLSKDAVSIMKHYLNLYPGEVSILTIGPLTNVAQLLKSNPGIENNIKELVIMGGAIESPGNKNRVAEFNFFVDPEAADIVIRSDCPKVLVPLDPCNVIKIQLDLFDSLKGKALYANLHKMMRHFIAGISKHEKVKAALVYDALAAFYFLDQKAFKTVKMDIVIETKGEHTFGMSVADRRKYSERHPNITVVTSIHRERFEWALLSALKNTADLYPEIRC
ncbi:MAG: nucleoside hydrolase [Candidatus Nitrotoga sp.]|nr:MAG: nucleoside hydrolase [Candidatus Saccharibacteria bacterium]